MTLLFVIAIILVVTLVGSLPVCHTVSTGVITLSEASVLSY